MTLTKRLEKGSALTAAEHDGNIDHLASGTNMREALNGLSGSERLPLAAVDGPTDDGRSLVGAADYSAMRTLLALAPGTDVQAYSAVLAAIAALTNAADKLPYFTGSGNAATTDFSAFGRTLIDDADAATARTTLGALAATAAALTTLLTDTHTAGGATASALASILGDFVDGAGEAFVPASDAQARGGTSGFLPVTAQILQSHYGTVTITPVGGTPDTITVDGSAFMVGMVTMVDDTDAATVTGLDGRLRFIWATASGADRLFTASDFDRKINFYGQTGVLVRSGSYALFGVIRINGQDVIFYVGQNGDETAPVTLTVAAATPDTITLDGARCPYAGIATLVDDTNFLAPTNLDGRPRRIECAASGATRDVTATGFTRTNFATVSVASGEVAVFIAWASGGESFLFYCGQSA